jgi:hypothetical protein
MERSKPGLERALPFVASASAARSLAKGLPLVQCACCCTNRLFVAILALLSLAVLFFCQLAPARSLGLLRVRRPVFLVPFPENRILQHMRNPNANNVALN